MGEVELLDLIRSTNSAIAGHYAEVISINFAMVVAIFYFLNRSGLAVKALAYVIYLVGMFMFVGLMLEESNLKRFALIALGEIPRDKLSVVSEALLDLQSTWLFVATAVLLNAGLWLLLGAVTWLLFVWRKPDPSPLAGDSASGPN